jgi:hypothetical protein
MSTKVARIDIYELIEKRLMEFEERLSKNEMAITVAIERLNEQTTELDSLEKRFNTIEPCDKISKTISKRDLNQEKEVIEEIDLNKIPFKDAKQLTKEFVENHPGSTYSEIFIGLRLDPDLVLNALKDLSAKNEIRGFPIER